MDKTQKFFSDIQRIKKFNRNGSDFNLAGALRDIENLFVSQNRGLEGLCRSLFDFWKNVYASGPELTDEAVEKISALQAFVNLEDGTDALGGEDWERVKDEVGFSAEDIPLDVLSSMMKIVVENGAI